MEEERWDTGLRYDDRGTSGGGRFASVFKRIFGDGENVLAWGVPLYRAWGIRVRAHLLFLLFIGVTLSWSAIHPGQIGLVYMAPLLAIVFGLVLLHEYGHCVACRLVGGEANEIVLWPLGGLAMCRPPHHWKAEFVTTVGGPAVNAALFVILAPTVYIVTGTFEAVIFNPFEIAYLLGTFGGSFLTRILWSIHYVNLVLLLFNFIPMFPMDGGRVLHTLLWRKLGHARAIVIATTVALVFAGVLATVGLVFGSTTLLAVAAFCGFASWQERQRARLLHTGSDLPFEPPAEEPEDDAADRAAAEQAEVDRVLAKISTEGMGSLTAKERRLLKRATRRSRETQ